MKASHVSFSLVLSRPVDCAAGVSAKALAGSLGEAADGRITHSETCLKNLVNSLFASVPGRSNQQYPQPMGNRNAQNKKPASLERWPFAVTTGQGYRPSGQSESVRMDFAPNL